MKKANQFDASGNEHKLLALYKLLHQRMTEVRERECHNLAIKLNDQAIQSLFALHLQLSAQVSHSAAVTPDELADSLLLIADLVEDLQSVARSLRPFEIDTLNLAETLEQVCELFSEKTGIPVTFSATPIPDLAEAELLCFFRLLQAALKNVAEHAQASQVWVTLRFAQNEVMLKVEDNGKGLEKGVAVTQPEDAPGLTLFDLMLRFQQLNGRLLFQSRTSNGTSVTAVVPHHPTP